MNNKKNRKNLSLILSSIIVTVSITNLNAFFFKTDTILTFKKHNSITYKNDNTEKKNSSIYTLKDILANYQIMECKNNNNCYSSIIPVNMACTIFNNMLDMFKEWGIQSPFNNKISTKVIKNTKNYNIYLNNDEIHTKIAGKPFKLNISNNDNFPVLFLYKNNDKNHQATFKVNKVINGNVLKLKNGFILYSKNATIEAVINGISKDSNFVALIPAQMDCRYNSIYSLVNNIFNKGNKEVKKVLKSIYYEINNNIEEFDKYYENFIKLPKEKQYQVLLYNLYAYKYFGKNYLNVMNLSFLENINNFNKLFSDFLLNFFSNVNTYEMLTSNDSDHFAVRPYKFDIIIDNKINNKNYDNTIISGKTFNFKIKAIDYNNQLIKDFNKNINNLKINAIFINKDLQNKQCKTNKENNTNFINCSSNEYLKINMLGINNSIINGESKSILSEYNEVGKIKLFISEKHDGTEFAKIDENDRTIKDKELYITGSKGITFIPYKYYLELKDVKGYINNKETNFGVFSSNINEGGLKVSFIIKGVNYKNKSVKYLDKNYYIPNEIFISCNLKNIPNNLNFVFQNVDTKYLGNNNNATINETIKEPNFKNGILNINYKFTFIKNYFTPQNEFIPYINKFYTSSLENNKVRLINSGILNKKLLPFRYFRFHPLDLITNKYNYVEFYAQYEYLKNNKWVVANEINKSYIKDIKVPVNNYYKGLVNIKKYTINKGIEKLLFNMNMEILPFGFTVHYNIPKWLWYSPFASNYSFKNSNCFMHPCSMIRFEKLNNIKNKNNNNNNNNSINNDNVKGYKNNKGILKFNY